MLSVTEAGGGGSVPATLRMFRHCQRCIRTPAPQPDSLQVLHRHLHSNTKLRHTPQWPQGGAPDGVEYVDVEEEYVVDEQGRGSWQPARPLAKPAPKAPRAKKERKVYAS